MSPMVAKCDHCGTTVSKNVATDPIVSTRKKLTVQIKVMRAEGLSPIVCERCARSAAYYCDREAEE